MKKMLKMLIVLTAVSFPAALCAQPLPHWNQLDAASTRMQRNIAQSMAKQSDEAYHNSLSHLSALGDVFYKFEKRFHHTIETKTTAAKTGVVSNEVMAHVVNLAIAYQAYVQVQEEQLQEGNNSAKTYHPEVLVGATAREMWSANKVDIARQNKIMAAKKAQALNERTALLKFANKQVGSFRLLNAAAYVTQSGLSAEQQARVNALLKDVRKAVAAK